jgi:antirestriction protein ArdC
MEFFLFATWSRPFLEPTESPIQWVPAVLTPRVKRSWRKANHPPPSGVEVKNTWSYTSIPTYIFMAWCSVKQCVHLNGVVRS